jgi:hypothetical protein
MILVKSLEEREEKKFWKARAEKIEVQMNHMLVKQEGEVGALDKKLDLLIREQDSIRKKEQQAMLNKFINIQS